MIHLQTTQRCSLMMMTCTHSATADQSASQRTCTPLKYCLFAMVTHLSPWQWSQAEENANYCLLQPYTLKVMLTWATHRGVINKTQTTGNNEEKCDYTFKLLLKLDFHLWWHSSWLVTIGQKLIVAALLSIQSWKKTGLQFRKIENKRSPWHVEQWKSFLIPRKQTLILDSLSLFLVSLSLTVCFSTMTDWGGLVAIVTRSQYVARMQQREPEKEQPTLVTMVTHLLELPRSSSFLRLWFLSLTGPHRFLCCHSDFACLYIFVCSGVGVCVYLCVCESHLSDQEGGVALFIVAHNCKVSVGGAALWVGPVLVALHLYTENVW